MGMPDAFKVAGVNQDQHPDRSNAPRWLLPAWKNPRMRGSAAETLWVSRYEESSTPCSLREKCSVTDLSSTYTLQKRGECGEVSLGIGAPEGDDGVSTDRGARLRGILARAMH